MMKLIVESGATKSDWRLVTDVGCVVEQVYADGINLSTMSMDAIDAIIRGVSGKMAHAGADIGHVYMYAAGVATQSVIADLKRLFSGQFGCEEVDLFDDLMAAARAVCGHSQGVVAILGTGSNSCFYDGEKIVKRVYSGGFILGDEGSAAALGKRFIADFLKGLLPSRVTTDFISRYKCDYATIIENVYRTTSSPSAYLGGFAPFIMEHYEDEYIRHLVEENFRAFIRRSLKQYDVERYAVGVVGGFGCALKDVFSRIAEQEGVRVSKFVTAPIEELIKYHTL